MSKHHVPVLAPSRPAGVRSRRVGLRRTPQDNVRASAAWVLERTLGSLAPVDPFLAGELERCDERDRGLLRELVLGTLRWLRRLDHVIARASNRRFEEIEEPLHWILRVAAYQLLFLDRMPDHPIVHEAVEQAHCVSHRGAAGFVNAVLRRIARARQLADWPVDEADPVRRLAIETSHPDFLVARWLERLGRERTRAVLAANNRPKPLQLLAFRDRGGRELLAESLIDEGLQVEPAGLSLLGLTVRAGSPFATEAFRRGDCYIQDEASQLAALLPEPRAGERILDAAAAPGGKSFALLAWEPAVRLVLSDASLARIGPLRANLQRLRRPLPVLVADAAQFPSRETFDRVVLDLPCSGTGTLRKNPEIKWRLSEGEIERLSGEALGMAAALAPRVAPGGLLVLITCSLEAEENEDLVARFLDQAPEFAPAPLADLLPPRVARWTEGPGRWRVLPGGDHDGFTVHVLARRR